MGPMSLPEMSVANYQRVSCNIPNSEGLKCIATETRILTQLRVSMVHLHLV
jgi:hypothetical protein